VLAHMLSLYRAIIPIPSRILLSSTRSLPRLPTPSLPLLFFFNDPPTTEIYTLSLHDALPISVQQPAVHRNRVLGAVGDAVPDPLDRKSTRLNSSHVEISYAVFCLKKKKQQPEL